MDPPSLVPHVLAGYLPTRRRSRGLVRLDLDFENSLLLSTVNSLIV